MRRLFLSFVVTLLVIVPGRAGESSDIPGLIASVRREPSLTDAARRSFESGVSSWNESRFLSARNHWVRARAWMERTLPVDSPAREAIGTLVEEADRLSQPEPALEVLPAPSPSPRPRRSHARSHSRAHVPRVATGKKVMEHARAAQRAGQVEKAARLMRIASRLPGGEEAAAQAEALEREAISGSGSGW